MCTVSDIVLEVKTLTDGEIYSIRTLQEIRDTFPKKDVIGIENIPTVPVNVRTENGDLSADLLLEI